MVWQRLETGTAPAGPRRLLFSEPLRTRAQETLSDRYLRLTAQELLACYSDEVPVTIRLGRHEYVLPASFAAGLPDVAGLGDSLRFTLVDVPFSLVNDNRLDAYTKPLLSEISPSRYNGLKVRLASLDTSNLRGTLCPVTYYDALTTNFAMDHRPVARAESLREYLHHSSRSLGAFNGHPLANHLGVVCIVESSDGMLVAQRRSLAVEIHGGSISASVSGSLDFADVTALGARDLTLAHLARAVFRESLGELGIVGVRSLHFLGLIREFLRGGKPELYFYARCAESFDGIQCARRAASERSESDALIPFEYHSARAMQDEAARVAFTERAEAILLSTSGEADFAFATGVVLTSLRALRGLTSACS